VCCALSNCLQLCLAFRRSSAPQNPSLKTLAGAMRTPKRPACTPCPAACLLAPQPPTCNRLICAVRLGAAISALRLWRSSSPQPTPAAVRQRKEHTSLVSMVGQRHRGRCGGVWRSSSSSKQRAAPIPPMPTLATHLAAWTAVVMLPKLGVWDWGMACSHSSLAVTAQNYAWAAGAWRLARAVIGATEMQGATPATRVLFCQPTCLLVRRLGACSVTLARPSTPTRQRCPAVPHILPVPIVIHSASYSVWINLQPKLLLTCTPRTAPHTTCRCVHTSTTWRPAYSHWP
jgi:hypothetical protein